MNELIKIVIIGPESTGKSTLCALLAAHYHTLWCPEYAREYLLTHGIHYTYGDLLTIAKGQLALEEEHVVKSEELKVKSEEGEKSKVKSEEGENVRWQTTDVKNEDGEKSKVKSEEKGKVRRQTTDVKNVDGERSKVKSDDGENETANQSAICNPRLNDAVGQVKSKIPLLFIDTDMYVMKVWSEYVFKKCDPYILEQIATRKYNLYLLCNTDLPWEDDVLRENPDEASRIELYGIYKNLLTNQSTPWVEISGSYTERLQTAVGAVDAFLAKQVTCPF